MTSKVGRKRGIISPFIAKVFEILETSQYKDLIAWSDDGEVFTVPNIASFAAEVLPQFFKHKNYSSFVRQLNMYGFRKLKTEGSENSFSHPIFKRSNKAKLHTIKKIKKEFSDENDEEAMEDYNQPFGTHSSQLQGKSRKSKDGVSDPMKVLNEMNAKFESFTSCAKELKEQAEVQADQIRQLHQEIQSTKELNEQRHKILQQVMMKGPTNAYGRQFINPLGGMPAFGIPFIPFAPQSFEGMARLAAPRGYKWDEQTQNSFNRTQNTKEQGWGLSHMSNVRKPLHGENELELRDKLVKKEGLGVNLLRSEGDSDAAISNFKAGGKKMLKNPPINPSKMSEYTNAMVFNSANGVKLENDPKEINLKTEERDMYNHFRALGGEAMLKRSSEY